eukprot:CAMPEP_0181310490 /NCGR_PEP_ID=MMETSP1101-20121128/12613_1 /TAXON_ID=46948 /ORGANISM="Rhodomonas abbreviata, Strain Caron Lab Isolate" /LENGTH=483 /DNA_ID=CAMNT_0023417121 /DNA_START=131 /DNA_END=1582 /DNA_ORIENTATION=-
MSVLRKILRGEEAKLDDTVADYLNGICQDYIQNGSLDGEPATPDDVYESCSDFIQELEVARADFLLAVAQLSEAKENASDESPNGASNQEPQQHAVNNPGISAKSKAAANPSPTAQQNKDRPQQATVAKSKNSQNAGQQAGQHAASRRADAVAQRNDEVRSPSTNTQGTDRKQEPSSDGRKQRAFSTIQETVRELFRAGELDAADPTIIEYIGSVTEDFVADEEADAEDYLETIVGVAPELASVVTNAPVLDFFIGRVRFLVEQRAASIAVEKPKPKTEEEPPHSSAAAASSKPEPEEERENIAAERRRRGEELAKTCPELQMLMELFPDTCPLELKWRLDAAEGDLQEAIERTVQALEFEELTVSSEDLHAQRAAFDEEAKEALRQRALLYYSNVKEMDKIEVGKRAEAVTSKSATLEKDIQKMLSAGDNPRMRYINNEVVSHKGERFIMAKTRNAVPEDPKTFIGLKIKSKKKGGPSPNFK